MEREFKRQQERDEPGYENFAHKRWKLHINKTEGKPTHIADKAEESAARGERMAAGHDDRRQ